MHFEKTENIFVLRMNMAGSSVAVGLIVNSGGNTENLFTLCIIINATTVCQRMILRNKTRGVMFFAGGVPSHDGRETHDGPVDGYAHRGD